MEAVWRLKTFHNKPTLICWFNFGKQNDRSRDQYEPSSSDNLLPCPSNILLDKTHKLYENILRV